MNITGWTTEAIAAVLVPYAFAEIAEHQGAPSQWADQDGCRRFVRLLETGQGSVAMPRAIVASVQVGPDSKAWGHTTADALERVVGLLDGTPWQIEADTRQIKRHRKSAAVLTW